MKTWSRVSLLVLSLILVATWGYVARAQSIVDINLPTDPAPITKTTLNISSIFSTPSVTVPASAVLTVVVKNTGAVAAQHLALEQQLPPGITLTSSPAATLDDLGSLAPGESMSFSWNLHFTDALTTDRYTVEQIVTAANADATESDASIDVTNGAVLGATDSTLAETGNNPIGYILIGSIFLILGGCMLSHARRASLHN